MRIPARCVAVAFLTAAALCGVESASAQFTLNPPIDVIGNLSAADFNGNGYGTNTYKDFGNEPSVAVNPVNPNQLLVSSFAFGAGVFSSSNGGAGWSSQFTITQPLPTVGIPNDWRFAYDSGGILHGAVLGGGAAAPNVYVGSSANPTGAGWAWTNSGSAVNTINNPASLNGADQPWIALSGSNVYVAYDVQGQANGIRVATSTNGGANFTKDTAANNTGLPTSVVPGERIATDGAGNLYNVYTLGTALPPAGEHSVSYYLNRSRDGGATWDFNGSTTAGGILVASGTSRQVDATGTQASNTWFAGVNDLRGSIDAVAADSTGAHVYVAYGVQDGAGTDRIYLTEYHPFGGFLVGSTSVVVSPAGQRAALPSLTVLANGAVVVQYETYNAGNNTVNVNVADSTNFGASIANNVQEYSFTPLTLSQATGGTGSNREFGDYVYLTSVGNSFYGTFAGLGNVNAGGINTTGLIDPFLITGNVRTPYIWANPVSGSWNTAGYWLNNSVPNLPAIDVVINAASSNSLTITLDGPQTIGTLVLGNSYNSATGYTLIPGSGGSLTFNNSGSLASITVTDGSHAISAPVTLAGTLVVSVANNATLNVSGNIGQTANFGLALFGPGNLVLAGNNTYSGGTIINGGLLQAGNNSALGASTGGLAVNSGIFDVHGYSINVGALSGGGIIDNLYAGGALTVGNGGASSTFSGTMQNTLGQLSLVKVGAGSIGTTGNITLSGSITVNDGYLAQSAGNVQASALTAAGGRYYLSAGQLSAAQLTAATSGTLEQVGGTAHATVELLVDGAGATYSMSNGSLNTNGEFVGFSGKGSFTQSGGTHSVSSLSSFNLGYNSGSGGTYNLQGGSLSCLGGEYIGYSGNGSFTQSGGTNTAGPFDLGFNASGRGSYNLSGNGKLFATDEDVGLYGAGSFTQSGGTHTVSNVLDLGYNAGSNGTYNLSGNGVLSTVYENIGLSGSASFTQSGGTQTVTQQLTIAGPSASYTQSGGLLSTTTEYVAYFSPGSFLQQGGHHAASSLYIGYGGGSSGVYNQSAGSLAAQNEYLGYGSFLNLGSTGSFTQSGGANSIASTLYLGDGTAACNGTYNLSGNGVLSSNAAYVGYSGSGSFVQSGGTHNVFALTLGYNAGSNGAYQQYSSNSSLLNAGNEFIGYSGSGSFTQSAGSNAVIALTIGYQPSSSGTYYQSGGVLSAGSEYVGFSGTGSFTQIGGTHSAGNMYLGYFSGSSGTYSLGGGTLNCSQIAGGGGASTFYFNGGVLAPTASNSNFMSGLTAAYVEYNGALINTNGQNITIAQPLLNGSGGGSLEKFGAGALTLTAANTYTNGTILYGGTLVAANTAGSALGSGPLLPEGGVLAAGPAGGTVSGPVLAGGAPYTIAPGAALASGYGTLNLNGGLAATSYTKLLFNINTASVLGTGGNGLNIYGGDLLNFNGGTLNVGGGQIALVNTPTQTGDYRLVDNATLTGGAASLNNLILPNQSGISYVLSTAVDSSAGYIDLVVGVGNAGASGGTWTHSGNGSWATGSFWSGGLFPSSGTATLGDPSGSIAVTLDGYRTAGALVFVDSVGGYTLSQGTGGALTLGTSAGASIAVNSGANIISAPLQMAGNLAVGVAGGASLQLSGPLSESTTGTSFTFNGPGLLNYSAVGTFTGNTSVNGGTLQIAAPGYLPAAFEYVANGTVIQTGGSNVASKDIYFGYFAYASGTLSGGQMSAPSEYFGYGALCDFVQTGGTNAVSSTLTIADVSSFQASSYTLSGNGQINATNETFGLYGHANFIQNGGNNQVYYSLTIGTNSGVYPYANYFLNSGNLSAFIETIGVSGNGDILQAGGNNSVAWEMDVGYNSTSTASYFLGGGSLSVPMEYIGYNGTGVFTQNGGTNSVASSQTTPVLDLGYQATGNGSYALSGSGLLSVGFHEYIGDNGTGSFTQSGGTHTVYGDLLLGNNAGSSGSYLLSSGLLYAGVGGNATEYIGNSGSGSFTQTGGNHIVSGLLLLGNAAGATGTFDLQGGSLSALDEWVGASGNGTFTQSGGINAVQYSLFLGTNGGSGTYSLSGNGQLSALYEFIAAPPDTGMYSGTGVFLQTGGTNLAGTLWLGYQDGYSGTYNLNGGLLSVSNGVTSGSGTGTLNLDGGMLEMNGNSINVGAFSAMSGVLSDVGGITSGGTQGLVKSQSVSGNNVLVLSGVNTYSGPTTVNAGMLVAASGPMISATSIGNVTLNGGTLAVGAAGGMISGPVLAGSGPHTIAPGAALSSGYGTLTLNGGLSTNNYTTLAFNLNLSSSIGSGVNGLPIYGGDLIDMGSSTLTVMGGSITFAINPTAAGDYRLIANAGGSPVLGNFSLPSQIGWKYSLSTTDDTGFIDAVASAVALTGGTWTFNGSGSWSVGSNWSSNPNIPNGDTVTFPDVAGTTAPITVTLDGNQSAGDLVFNVSTTNGYTLSQGTGGALTLGTGAGASITVLGGAHTISAPLVMAGNLAVSTAAGTSLQLSGALSESTSGSALSFGGAGQVIFSGTGSYTGDTTVSAGTLQLLPGGMLPAANEYVGSSGSASLIQSGGSNVVSASLYLGNNPGDSGTYNLSGGVLFCANTEAIGVAGIGSVTQSGGTNSAGTLVLAQSSNSSGSYNLNGGLLSLSALNQGSGAAAFNIGIGTFQAASNFSTSVPMNLSAAGSSGVFDTNGNLLTLAGPLSGPGGLQVIGSGALTLAVSNSYTGTTLVSNGTLLLGDSNALSGSTFDSSGSGALSFGSSINAFVFGGLQGSGSLALTDVSGTDVTLTVGGNNANTTFYGNLSDLNGLGSLTKVGTGTLVLSGSNSYGAGTAVLDGTLILTNSEAITDVSSLTVGDPSMFPAPVVPSLAGSPVPEPGTLVLLAAGAALMAIYRKWRERSN